MNHDYCEVVEVGTVSIIGSPGWHVSCDAFQNETTIHHSIVRPARYPEQCLVNQYVQREW